MISVTPMPNRRIHKPSDALLDRIVDAKEREERRRGVEAARLRLDVAQAIHDLREKEGLSQTALADLVGTKQPNISRLENGESGGLPSLDLLGRVAAALNARLEVRIVRPRKGARRRSTARKRAAQRRK